MTEPYGGSLACGKANGFSEGPQAEHVLDWYKHQLKIASSLCWLKRSNIASPVSVFILGASSKSQMSVLLNCFNKLQPLYMMMFFYLMRNDSLKQVEVVMNVMNETCKVLQDLWQFCLCLQQEKHSQQHLHYNISLKPQFIFHNLQAVHASM